MMESNGKRESSNLTKKGIFVAAFDNFYQVGFSNASLEKISKDANVSRGATYWHFKNKKDLYEQTVKHILNEIYKKKEVIYQNSALNFKEKAVEIIWLPHENKQEFRFLQQADVTIALNKEFEELEALISQARLDLYDFFKKGIEALQRESPRLQCFPSKDLANLLYSYFEGMYSSYPPQEITENYTKDGIRNCLSAIFDK
ncbi:TetR/AcrR family transcriptional regulator [Enterococcus rivorum]|nr:TetR/AcrR family transcriptional regulator [Enterococcus rivorum]MBP2097760.1 AcrR family transcriptional regulator [Enterococcus rivorum]